MKLIHFLKTIGDSISRFFSMTPNYNAYYLYKIGNACYKNKIPILPLFFRRLNGLINSADIHFKAEIGEGIIINHSQGVVIGSKVKLGKRCVIYPGAVLGVQYLGSDQHPTLGDNVIIGSGAKVLGEITVGDNVKIGANAVVLSDVPSNATVVGIPARVVKKRD